VVCFLAFVRGENRKKKKGQDMTKSHEKQKNYRAIIKEDCFSHTLKRPCFGMWLLFLFFSILSETTLFHFKCNVSLNLFFLI
jgi:hypothetical protein